MVGRAAADERDALPLPARLHRRGVRLARRRRRRRSPRATPYAPNSPYSASKAGSDHLVRAYHHTYGLPDAHDQLLEQLRAVPVSREADPADDRQRARGQAAAGLRRRPERARLAVRRRPLRGDPHRARAAARPGETYNVGGNAEMTQSRRRAARSARSSREEQPGPRLRRRSSRSSRTGRATTAATRSTRRRSAASSAGSPRRRSSRGCAARSAGISTTTTGSTSVASKDYQKWIALQYDELRLA